MDLAGISGGPIGTEAGPARSPNKERDPEGSRSLAMKRLEGLEQRNAFCRSHTFNPAKVGIDASEDASVSEGISGIDSDNNIIVAVVEKSGSAAITCFGVVNPGCC